MNRITELAEFLKAHDRFAVIGHVHPDGDAVGCAVTMTLVLQAMGKEAFAYLPGGMPVLYRSFECPAAVAGCHEEVPFTPETAFSVDVSALDRMGSGGEIFDACSAKCAIDHHATNPGFGDVCVIDPEAAACAEVARELIDAIGMDIPAVAANWLFIAACTDSGRFGFSNTRGETLETAAACVRAGADVDHITSVLYRTRTKGHTRLLGDALYHMHIDETHRIAWTSITSAMFARCGASREDTEGIVNYLVEMEGIESAFVLIEEAEGVKASLRSHGRVNVAKDVAQPLGGGGHACAAGVSLAMSAETAAEELLKLLIRTTESI